MGKTSKDPKRVLLTAYEVGKGALPDFSHPRSPQTFTQPQLFACLVLKAFFQTDYRGVEGILESLSELRETIGLTRTPHFTTLQKAEKRLLDKVSTRKLLQQSIKRALTNHQMKRIVELAAIDGSGFESRHVSDHYLKRQNMTGATLWHSKYPKVGVLCDCSSHMTLAIAPGLGPSPDIGDFAELLKEAVRNLKLKFVVADAGYDSERSHELAREQLDIKSIIPPLIGRRSEKLPKGRWRRNMRLHFDKERYGQRWQVETVFSMAKRLLGSALRARRRHAQNRELRLKLLTLNIMLLLLFLFAQ